MHQLAPSYKYRYKFHRFHCLNNHTRFVLTFLPIANSLPGYQLVQHYRDKVRRGSTGKIVIFDLRRR